MNETITLDNIEEAIAEFRRGKFVVVVDDANRENEGDLIISAEKITAKDINFMLTHARGVLCVPLTKSRCLELNLYPHTNENTSIHDTPFTVTVDKLEGCTTGVSAKDRAATVRALANSEYGVSSFGRPGHINPLYAADNGVLERDGHTEAAIDLARIAGLKPAAALIEIMNEDGTMSRLPELRAFADKWGLKLISIADLKDYREKHNI